MSIFNHPFRNLNTFGLSIAILITIIHANAAGTVQLDSTRSGWNILPVLSYSPETRLAGGVVATAFFRHPEDSAGTPPSTLLPAVIYTQKKQISAEISGNAYWRHAQWHLRHYVGYKKFPDIFYGIGNNTHRNEEEDYTPGTFEIRLNLQRKFSNKLYVGVSAELQKLRLIEVEAEGKLNTGHIPGSDGGTTAGVGVSLFRDFRDNVFYPTRGGLIRLSVERFDSKFGGDFGFTRTEADIRKYWRPAESRVLALQLHTGLIHGTAPFNMLSMIGKSCEYALMRGYYHGRFRDRHSLVMQGEYRMPVWGRLGCALFMGVGEVAPGMREFTWSDLKFTWGGGLRFRISRTEKINLRLDCGLAKGTSGFYVAIGEAF